MFEDQPAPHEPLLDSKPSDERLTRKGVIWFYVVQCLVLVLIFIFKLVTGDYGFALFCALPFSVGLTVGAYTIRFKTKRLLRGTLITLLVVGGLSVLLIATGLDGAICVILALGVIVLPALLGMAIGYWIRKAHRVYLVLFVVFLNSSFITYDYVDETQIESTATEVVTINAPKEKIWQVLTNGVRFHPNTNMFFKAGVSYPTSMKLSYTTSSNCYLVCTLNNGSASLEVEKIDSLKSIRFSIPEGTQSMKELSPYDSIHAAHLEGYFKASYGEFRIEEISPSECHLIASTSYNYKITPAFYWEWWTDYLVNTMHRHVLNDIKTLAEEN